MNPKERSVFYRGVLFFIITVFVLTQLSSVDQQQYPWVSVVNIFAEVCLFLAGVVFVLFVISRQFKQSTNAPASSQQTQPAPSQQTQPASSQRSRFDFSSDSWFNMARLAVLASVILAVATVAILVFVPPPGLCPNWHLPDRASTPLWTMLASLTVPLLVFQAVIIIRWNWVVQKMIDETADYPTTAPVTYILVSMVLMASVTSQIPLVFLVSRCWLVP